MGLIARILLLAVVLTICYSSGFGFIPPAVFTALLNSIITALQGIIASLPPEIGAGFSATLAGIIASCEAGANFSSIFAQLNALLVQIQADTAEIDPLQFPGDLLRYVAWAITYALSLPGVASIGCSVSG